MPAIETSEGTLRISDVLLQAVVRHAEGQAALTAAALDATGLFDKGRSQLPAGFLLELGAVVELGVWERQGLREYLDTDLPTYREAARTLAQRADRGLAEFRGEDPAPLARRVRNTWLEQLAWDGHEMLGADVVLGDLDEDAFVDVMADFLWAHRHELSRFATHEGN